MKNLCFIFIAFALVIGISVNAQLINMNPDPNGSPWWTNDAVRSQIV